MRLLYRILTETIVQKAAFEEYIFQGERSSYYTKYKKKNV